MAGFPNMYVIGGAGGFMGSDGVNPIEFLILVGDAGRQWLEPHYFDTSISPIGELRVLVPAGPNLPDSLLDACIAFCPRYFKSCPSLAGVELALRGKDQLDFHARPQEIPREWTLLREEARAPFAAMNIWQAKFAPIERGS